MPRTSKSSFKLYMSLSVGVNTMAGKTSKKSAKVAKNVAAKRVAAKPTLLAGGNPQIAKADGDAPCRRTSRPC